MPASAGPGGGTFLALLARRLRNPEPEPRLRRGPDLLVAGPPPSASHDVAFAASPGAPRCRSRRGRVAVLSGALEEGMPDHVLRDAGGPRPPAGRSDLRSEPVRHRFSPASHLPRDRCVRAPPDPPPKPAARLGFGHSHDTRRVGLRVDVIPHAGTPSSPRPGAPGRGSGTSSRPDCRRRKRSPRSRGPKATPCRATRDGESDDRCG